LGMSVKKTGQRIVCHCLQVTEAEVLGALRARTIRCVKDISRFTEAGGGCTACHPALEEYLNQTPNYLEASPPICSVK